MASAFVSKSRRVRFELTLHIVDLNNVPLVSGTSFIKWHLPSSTAAEHRGRTPKSQIQDHRVLYEYEKQLPVRLTVSKDGMLQETSVHFEVLQEYSSGGRGERIMLGHIKLNLAEYVEVSEGNVATSGHDASSESRGIVRRYLMQDSKINSTLKLGISMKHIEGTREYYAPPLRTAPVFGGIAGIMTSEQQSSSTHLGPPHTEGDAHSMQDGILPTLSTTNKELGELQDIYRRTLAASWASQPGELKADEAIEDIFACGDGWGKNGRPAPPESQRTQDRSGSGSSTPNPDSDTTHRKMGSVTRGILATGRDRYAYGKHGKVTRKGAGEIDEFEVREDLRSWSVGAAA